MTTIAPLTDAIIEAALARCAARVDNTGLRDEIMAGIATTPQARGSFVARPGWATWPATSLRLAWLLLVMVLLLALAGGLLIVGSDPRSLPRHPQALVAPGIEAIAQGPLGASDVVAGSDGLIWAYTQGHLVRLDPISGDTRTWTIADDAAFAEPSLMPARGGGVWLGGAHELRWFDGERFRDVVTVPSDAAATWSGTGSPNATLWASAEDGGVLGWDGKAWTRLPAIRPDVTAGAIALDSGGHVWVAGWTYPGPVSQGVSRLDGSRWTTFTASDASALAGTVQSIAPTPTGTVWVGTEVGIARFDGTSWTSFGAAEIGAGRSWSVAVDPDGQVWAATASEERGVEIAHHDGTGWTLFGPDDGLPGPDASSYSTATVAASKEGVFVSTRAGLFRLADGRWEPAWTANEEASVPLLDLLAVSGDEAWGLWVGAWGNGVNEIWHFRDGVASRESGTEGVPSGVRDLALAPDGTLWAATDHGVATRAGGTWTIVDEQPAVAVAIAPDGTVWVGGEGPKARTVRRAGAGWDVRGLPDAAIGSLTTPGVASWTFGPAMAVDRAGGPWASGGNQGWFDTPGLLRFGGERWEEMRPVAEAGTTVFGNVVAAPDGAVWVTIDTTSANGTCCPPADPATQVARFKGGWWHVFGTADGLPANNVGLRLAISPDGTVWLSSAGGLFSFDGERWTAHFKGHDFGMVAAAPDGTLWASGDAGVVRIAPGAANAEPTGG
jgi:ligand-binding sensor domain-containing protein